MVLCAIIRSFLTQLPSSRSVGSERANADLGKSAVSAPPTAITHYSVAAPHSSSQIQASPTDRAATSKHDYQITTAETSETPQSHTLHTTSASNRTSSGDRTWSTPATHAASPLIPDSHDAPPEKHFHVQEVELDSSSSAHLPSFAHSKPTAADPPPPSVSPTGPTALSPVQSLSLDDEIEMTQRRIWVKRPGASATLVTVNDDDLVDSVRDVILHKYANSLGKSIDSPDITLKIVSREHDNRNVPGERVLGPEEPIGRTLDQYYAGGQSIEEALLIDVPQRKTPRPSPRPGNHHNSIAYGPYYMEDHRPGEGAREYFPPMTMQSPHLPQHPSQSGHPNAPHLPHSMAILTTGQIPALPSPGAHSTTRRDRRPKYVRQHTSSPTIMHSHQPNSNDPKQPLPNGIAPPAPLPTPPVQSDHRPSITPPNRTISPHPRNRPRRTKPPQPQQRSAQSITGEPPPKLARAGLLDGNVPPINVLIVEDNIINLRLLEQFMKRLKVRWKSAQDGREAVNTWRTGGFHLVLMDIQLPVMNGLEATKEIRRLESVNGIGLGLFGGQGANGTANGDHEINPEDELHDMNLFKSPVIIVALTASSLQSDRHEALAVGCNDFLTKPVGYPWMLRKVTEWGCMQALIDFDGWRQWKASAEKKDEGLAEEQKKAKEKDEKAKQKAALKAMFAMPPPSTRNQEQRNSRQDGEDGAVKPPVNGNSSGSMRAARNVRKNSGSGTILETHNEDESEE